MERVGAICEAVRAAGGRAYIVGGFVRDRVMAAPPARDCDIEAFGIDGAALRSVLEKFGRVDAVGEAFTVYKLGDIDVSIPRRDSKTGRGHRGFAVTGDPSMSVEEAARRRDFTINAMLLDPLTGEVIDPFGGIEDIRARRLRAVDPATFPEDSLRVLRAMQFAARFDFAVDPETVALCRSIALDDLPAERIWGEMEKLLLAPRPSLGLTAGLEMGVMDKLFPDLRALVGCPQNPAYHPEGDVWVHTLQALDVAAERSRGLDRRARLTVTLATLCHDLGKPLATQVIDGRIRHLDHEEAGVEPATRLLDRLNIHTIDGVDVRKQVIALVADHLKPSQFHRDRDRISDGAFRRLALRCDLDLLCRVAQADLLGRRATGAPEPSDAAVAWFRDRAGSLGPLPPAPLLLGRHLLEMGLPPGPRIGEITDKVYQHQLDGEVRTLDDALAAARVLRDQRV